MVLLGPALCRPGLAGLRRNLQNSLGVVPVAMESPRGLNDPVLGAIRSLCRQADRILLLGKKPDFTIGFGHSDHFGDARFAAVISGDDNLQLISNNLDERCDCLVAAPARLFAEQLCQYAIDESSRWPADADSDREQWNNSIASCLEQRPDTGEPITSGLLHPAQITASVERTISQSGNAAAAGASNAAAVLICDGGEFGQWAQAGIRVAPRMINGPSGAIGGSLACAVGAAVACPESLIFVMLGDGTAGFYLAELETIARERVPAIIIVGNDSRWNAEYQIQLDQYGEKRTHSCELPTGLRYDEVAQGLGMAGELIETASALDSALTRALERAANQRQATLLNVIMEGRKAPIYS